MATVFSPVQEMRRRSSGGSPRSPTWAWSTAPWPRCDGCCRATAAPIVQVGSALAYRGIPLQSAYCAAKHAMRGFTDSLRCELLHDGSRVRVTMVQLPALNTPQFDWVRRRCRSPRPVPPIYQPEVAARGGRTGPPIRGASCWSAGPTSQAIFGERIARACSTATSARTGYGRPADRRADARGPPGQPLRSPGRGRPRRARPLRRRRARCAADSSGSRRIPARLRRRRLRSARARCCAAASAGCFERSISRLDRARRGAGGRRVQLRCGGRRFAPAALRCSLRGAAAMHSAPAPGRGRPINASRRSGAARRTAPAALRCSAPQRRSTRRPPAPLREPTVQSATALRVATCAARGARLRAARCWRQGRGRASGEAPLRRRGAQGPGGCASPQGDASSAACPSTEHRQLAQRDAGRARASSALAPGHRAPQQLCSSVKHFGATEHA